MLFANAPTFADKSSNVGTSIPVRLVNPCPTASNVDETESLSSVKFVGMLSPVRLLKPSAAEDKAFPTASFTSDRFSGTSSPVRFSNPSTALPITLLPTSLMPLTALPTNPVNPSQPDLNHPPTLSIPAEIVS